MSETPKNGSEAIAANFGQLFESLLNHLRESEFAFTLPLAPEILRLSLHKAEQVRDALIAVLPKLQAHENPKARELATVLQGFITNPKTPFAELVAAAKAPPRPTTNGGGSAALLEIGGTGETLSDRIARITGQAKV